MQITTVFSPKSVPKKVKCQPQKDYKVIVNTARCTHILNFPFGKENDEWLPLSPDVNPTSIGVGIGYHNLVLASGRTVDATRLDVDTNHAAQVGASVPCRLESVIAPEGGYVEQLLSLKIFGYCFVFKESSIDSKLSCHMFVPCAKNSFCSQAIDYKGQP